MVTNALISNLQHIVPESCVITDDATLRLYACDRSNLSSVPGIVVLPATEDELVKVVRALVEAELQLTIRGGGSGITGGAVPVEGGAIISTARMYDPIEVDTDSGVVVAPAGARLIDIERAVAKHDYRLGDPITGFGVGTVGGAVARNSDGIGGRTGTLHGLVRGIRGVLANGQIVEAEIAGQHGQSLHGAALLIGSDGGLGVISSVRLAIQRKMSADRIVMAGFENAVAAAEAGAALITAGACPTIADVFDRESWSRASTWPAGEGVDGMLLVWISGLEADVDDEAAWVIGVCRDCHALRANVLDEDGFAVIRGAWEDVIRANDNRPERVPIDLSVPVRRMPELLQTLYKRANEQNVSVSGITRIVSGAVNMYAMVNPREDESVIRAGHFMEEMVEYAHELNGLGMAFHGVGLRRIDLLEHNRQQSDLEVLRSVRGIFTPTDAFSVPFVPPPPKERRDLRHRTAREPKIVAVRDAITAQLEHAASENESIQVQVSSSQVLSQVLRATGAHKMTTAIHDRPAGMAVDLSLSELKRVINFDPSSRVISVDSGMPLSALRDIVAEHGLWLPISPLIDRGTSVSDYLAWYRADSRSLGWGSTASRVVELTAVAGRGDIFSSGGLAGVQHTGPRLGELCLGTRHRYAIITGAAFELVPAPAMRATVQAEFSKATDADVAVQRWLGRIEETPKCRPSACCILIDAHYDEDASIHRQDIHAFVEFAGVQSSVERQVRWARHIADEAKAIDLHEAVNAESNESWWFARTHYRQWPGDRGDDVLHLVVWTGIAGWAELARKIRHVVQVHKYDCKLLIDLGAGRIDVLVDRGAIEPSPLVRLVSELVERSHAMLEVWSSELAGKWTGPVSPALETVRSDLKVNFDPAGVLPAGWGRKLVWSTPFESRRTATTS